MKVRRNLIGSRWSLMLFANMLHLEVLESGHCLAVHPEAALLVEVKEIAVSDRSAKESEVLVDDVGLSLAPDEPGHL